MWKSKTGGLVYCFGALLGLLATGCSGDDDAPPPWRGSTSSNRPVAGCEHISHGSCDVRTASCQDRLLELAACIREDAAPPMPPIAVLSESEFADFLYDLIEGEPDAEVNHLERALVSLGMAQPGAYGVDVAVSDLVENIGGLYRHDADDILIVDHGASFDRDMMSSILLHEFVHYLQDLEVDLSAFTEEFSVTTDSALAATSVVEGEAEFHQLRYFASLAGVDPNRTDYGERFETMVSYSEDLLLGQPSPITQVRSVFPYAWGGRYMQATWDAGGREAVSERFAAPPRQSRSFMGPALTDVVARSFESPAAPAGLRLFTEDVGGAFTLFLYATTIMDVTSARELALDWRGDRMSIYATDDDSGTVVVWRIALENAYVAAELAAAAGRVLTPDELRYDGGSEVILAVADPVADVEWALDSLD